MSAGIAIEILFIILTSLTTIIRLYTKLTVSKSQDWEDCKCFIVDGQTLYLHIVTIIDTMYLAAVHLYHCPLMFD